MLSGQIGDDARQTSCWDWAGVAVLQDQRKSGLQTTRWHASVGRLACCRAQTAIAGQKLERR